MSRRLGLAFLFGGAVLILGCSDQPKLWKRSEIETIAEDFADASTIGGALEASYQARISRLEEENQALRAQLAQQQREIDRLFENDEAIRQNFNYLGRHHGIAPMPKSE
ncbi:hypothetical protein SAMN06297468_1170 [Altererythrobacter xiamenensis]|uniref:Uncharacterized protein n=1 Tax=Altererythrobacter xiamenensis TaxID=1316679 RepID=A0A1Y6F1X1_9SPHN|nr:hypothetical protein [Altererythrobacter xiamenensis]SMQ68898.1 hypothetical protein SAMN06297468_1170 [Altererythrobacter xiamenensis]